MLRRKFSYTFCFFPVPSFLIVETFEGYRFKEKRELGKDLIYFKRKIKNLLDKKKINKAKYIDAKFYGIKSAMDIHIDDKGGIVDNMGNTHKTAQSYKNYLKDNNLVIADWTQGSLQKEKIGIDRKEIEKTLIDNNFFNYKI